MGISLTAATVIAPDKPQPGSWTAKMEVVDIRGQGADKARQYIAVPTELSFCVTPESSAASTIASRAVGDTKGCTFDQQTVGQDGGFHLAGVCSKDGSHAKITADGSMTAAAQNVTLIVDEPAKTTGETLIVTFRLRLQRMGDCWSGQTELPKGEMNPIL